MARTPLTPQQLSSGGVEITYAAANAQGHSFLNTPGIELRVKNAAGSGINVIFQTPRTVEGLAIDDKSDALPANKEWAFGNFDSDVYERSDGTIWVDFSAVTTVTVALVQTT